MVFSRYFCREKTRIDHVNEQHQNIYLKSIRGATD